MAKGLTAAFRGSVYGLGTALAFSISPLFVRAAMSEGHSAEVGLSVGLIAAAATYAFVLAVSEPRALQDAFRADRATTLWELAAALAIVTGTWLRYEAMATIPLAIVSALARINILVILLLAGKSVTRRVWIGGVLIIAGTVLLSL